MARLVSPLAFLLTVGVVAATGVPAADASTTRHVATAAARPAVASGTDAGVLEPTLSCTSPDDPTKGVDTTVFGYVNHGSSAVRLEPGTWNLLIGAPGATAPSVFESGRHPHALEVHVAHGATARWALGTGEAVGPGPRCTGRLSPAVAGSIMRGTLVGGVPLAFVFLVFAVKKRRDRKREAQAMAEAARKAAVRPTRPRRGSSRAARPRPGARAG